MYTPPAPSIKNFGSLKTAVLWAGILGVAQSIIWMGLTITAILAYNCVLYITDSLSFGSMVKTVFFDVYFKGACKMSPGKYQNYDMTILDQVETVFDPQQVLIWDCVYLGVSVCWLIVSCVLLAWVRKDNVKKSLTAIYTWAFFVAAICCMDVASGVIFGVDYGRFNAEALKYNANSINEGPVDPMAATLIAGAVAAISMMIISFKGFVLWLINVGLLIYLLIRATRIAADKDGVDTLFNPRKDSNDMLTTRPPIRAYEEEKVEVQAYNNAAYVPDNRSTAETIEVNEEAIIRAAHMSMDSNLLDRRFRDLNNFQQYPAPNPQASRPLRQSSQVPVQETVVVATSGFPLPDYSPQPSPNGILRPRQY
ncbi:uncharacterized protein Dana_GF10173 [Drosophila ananassae]|uniref:Uncharacterized protein n=1 Tax=Drosophila ananassae TaxID=7217 RepID=B3M6R9_DROAN|nr:uncharacterized protein LOC6493047 [Drosophila ananassae]EDV39755.1 uncharacterized protein Dana_GF10173 [Drosophila ananassae]